jgi:hypothetical protein
VLLLHENLQTWPISPLFRLAVSSSKIDLPEEVSYQCDLGFWVRLVWKVYEYRGYIHGERVPSSWVPLTEAKYILSEPEIWLMETLL